MLACPHCSLALSLTTSGATCSNGHSFDRGRSGHLNLLVGGRLGPTVIAGDSADALAARRRFLSAGHYAPIARALSDAVGAPPGPLLDVGCGEGYYLSQLGVTVERYGLDVSKTAVQMAARAFPGTQFVVATAYHLPVLDQAVGVVVSVFAPHPFEEFARVMHPDGWWVTVTPGAHHLQEMRPVLQGEAAQKVAERLARRSVPPPEAVSAVRLEFPLHLDTAAADDLFSMTPVRYAGDRGEGARSVTVDVWVSSSR